MSLPVQIENVRQVALKTQRDFESLAKIHGAVNFQAELSFAMTILSNNSFLMKTAIEDQDSFKRAIIDVAAIGLSLSPVLGLAYLVPRDKKVVLDISFKGFLKLAVESGSIKWAKAEVVRKNDTYRRMGINKEPLHEFNPFNSADERGDIIGSYCLAKTHDGEFILTEMSAEDIQAIRDRSEAWKAFKAEKIRSTPWQTDTVEMIKKTLIRRAAKADWPKADTRDSRFRQAIDVTNEFEVTPVEAADYEIEASAEDARFARIRDGLKIIDRTEGKFLEHLSTVTRRKIEKLEDLTAQELDRAVVQVDQLVANTKKKQESADENAR